MVTKCRRRLIKNRARHPTPFFFPSRPPHPPQNSSNPFCFVILLAFWLLFHDNPSFLSCVLCVDKMKHNEKRETTRENRESKSKLPPSPRRPRLLTRGIIVKTSRLPPPAQTIRIERKKEKRNETIKGEINIRYDTLSFLFLLHLRSSYLFYMPLFSFLITCSRYMDDYSQTHRHCFLA